jgi:hypothetical protein
VLQLVIIPWANVIVDGQRRASESQRLELQLPPGTHRLRLENPNTLPFDTTFQIVSGVPTRLRIQMPPRSP